MILKNKLLLSTVISLIIGFAGAAHAAPTVTSPYVSKGETAMELKGEYNIDDNENDSWGTEISIGHGVTSFWEAEIGVELEDAGDEEDTEFTAFAIENKFQLAPKDMFFVDPGLKLEYKRSLNSESDEVEAQLLLAKTIGKFTNKSEFGIAHEFGDNSDDVTTYNAAYGLYYDYTEGYEFGAEWHSDFGDTTDSFDDQNHKFGPVAIIELGEKVEFETGALFGVSDGASDVTLKAILEYEF